jgi:hypothetical protein
MWCLVGQVHTGMQLQVAAVISVVAGACVILCIHATVHVVIHCEARLPSLASALHTACIMHVTVTIRLPVDVIKPSVHWYLGLVATACKLLDLSRTV